MLRPACGHTQKFLLSSGVKTLASTLSDRKRATAVRSRRRSRELKTSGDTDSPRSAFEAMRCLFLLPLMMLSSSTAFVAPVAPARPQHIVRAEKEGEAVAKKKGIPLALLIWPLIAVGDDVRARADTSIRHRREREREKARTGRSPRADLRLASPAAPRGAGHRDARAAVLEHELPQEVSFIHCLQGRGRVGDAPCDVAPEK